MVLYANYMENLSISATARTATGRHNIKLRKQGIIPAVLYGADNKQSTAVNLQVVAREFDKVFRKAGENTLVDLILEGGAKHKVLIHDVAKHYMKNEVIHVDFYEVDLTRKIHAKVPLEFVGIAPAVKELGGTFIRVINEVEVEAMPQDLPHILEVSIEGLITFDKSIHVSDIKVPDNVKVLGNPEEVVASVQPPRSEAELANLEQPTAEAEKAAIEGMQAEADKAKAEKGEGEEEAPAVEAKTETKKE